MREVLLISGGIVLAVLLSHVTIRWYQRRRNATNTPLSNLQQEAALDSGSEVDGQRNLVHEVELPKRRVILGFYIRDSRRKPGSKGSFTASRTTLACAAPDAPVFAFSPPGGGKTSGLVSPNLLAWEGGPAVSTSIKFDVATSTIKGRLLQGQAYVFDPADQLLGHPVEGLNEHLVNWTPLSTCETWQSTLAIAQALAAGASSDGAGGGGQQVFWRDGAARLLSIVMWTARRDPGTSMRDVRTLLTALDSRTSPLPDFLQYLGHPAEEQVNWDLLLEHLGNIQRKLLHDREAALQSGQPVPDDLQTTLEDCQTVSEETQSFRSIATEAGQTFAGFFAEAARILQAIQASRSVSSVAWDDPDLFDPEAFALSTDTLYIASPPVDVELYAPVITTLTQETIEAAYRVAQRQPGERLPAEMLLALDELVNVAPLPRLGNYTSTGRSFGLTFLLVTQSMSQLQERWGNDTAAALVNNASGGTLLLPKTQCPTTLNWFVNLFGETRVPERSITKSTSRGRSWGSGSTPSTMNEGTSTSETFSYTWRPLASTGSLSRIMDEEIVAVVGASRFQALQYRWYQDPDMQALSKGQDGALTRIRKKYRAVEFRGQA